MQEKKSRQERRQILSVLLYMLDPEAQFRCVKALRKRRAEVERKRKSARDRFFQNLNPGLNAWSRETVERRAASQHMQDRMEAGQLYSLPVGVTALPSLQSRLHASKQIQLSDQPLEDNWADPLSLNDSACSSAPAISVNLPSSASGQMILREEAADPRPTMFFRLSRSAPARARVLNLPAASGMKLQSTDLSVTLHAAVQSADACWVEVEAQSSQHVASPVSILSLCNADTQIVPSALQH